MPDKRNPRVPVALASAALLVVAVAPALAGDRDWCEEGDSHHRGFHCEVREMTLPAGRSVIAVDAAPNGGVAVEGWDRNEIRVLAKVVARADTDDEARDLASQVEIRTDGTIEADGPRRSDNWWGRGNSWSVSFRLRVPQRSALDLETTNGGISVTEVSGDLRMSTTNGGLTLNDLAGDVRARTTNGGVRVQLAGEEWDGDGLEVKTTNGGVTLYVPESYNARLETGTTNGSTEFDFPITVSGRIGKSVEADLGRGGRTVSVHTTNGGVRVKRR